MAVSIDVTDNTVRVRSPYNHEFIDAAKEIGGKWSDPYWVFDARDEDRVRDLCLEVYGEDGREIDPDEAVTVRLDVRRESEGNDRVVLAGRCLVRKYDRDKPPTLSDGVVVVEGGYPSRGGSRKNPRLEPKSTCVIEVRDISPSAARRMLEEVDGEIVEGDPEAAALSRIKAAIEQARKAGITDEQIAELLD